MISLSTCTTVPSMWSWHIAVSFLWTCKGCQHFLYSFFLILEFLLWTSCPWPNTGIHRGNKNKKCIPLCHHPVQRPVSLSWMAHINTCSYSDGTGTTVTLPFSLWLNTHYSGNTSVAKKWLDKTVPGKKYHHKFQERKRNFMTIIPPTCFKQFFYRCFLLSQAQMNPSIHFPGIAYAYLSSGGKTIMFERYPLQ